AASRAGQIATHLPEAAQDFVGALRGTRSRKSPTLPRASTDRRKRCPRPSRLERSLDGRRTVGQRNGALWHNCDRQCSPAHSYWLCGAADIHKLRTARSYAVPDIAGPALRRSGRFANYLDPLIEE